MSLQPCTYLKIMPTLQQLQQVLTMALEWDFSNFNVSHCETSSVKLVVSHILLQSNDLCSRAKTQFKHFSALSLYWLDSAFLSLGGLSKAAEESSQIPQELLPHPKMSPHPDLLITQVPPWETGKDLLFYVEQGSHGALHLAFRQTYLFFFHCGFPRHFILLFKSLILPLA